MRQNIVGAKSLNYKYFAKPKGKSPEKKGN